MSDLLQRAIGFPKFPVEINRAMQYNINSMNMVDMRKNNLKTQLFVIIVLIAFICCACANGDALGGVSGAIDVISREEGSGTRSAFVSLFDIVDADEYDDLTVTAEITNNTAVVMQSVASDADAIGYISLGSMSDTVKALKIDGAEPSEANIKNGSYAAQRPFIVVTERETDAAALDLINYILSDAGQSIVEQKGYVSINGTNENNASEYTPADISAKLVVAGSSSVSPVMESLIEAYMVLNPQTVVEMQQSDSSTGINAVIDGICQIGMSSRDITENEIAKGVVPTAIAIDGIAIIVNNSNVHDGISSEQVREIFLGNLKKWDELK
jgi:phosphate transport system substrate-binding protein